MAAMNPTASGYASENPRANNRYLEKLSGPLLDRIDIHVEVPAVSYPELTGKTPGTDTRTMRKSAFRTPAKPSRNDSKTPRPTPR